MLLVFTASVHAAAQGSAIVVNLLNQDPDPALAGDIVELRFGIENIGDESSENLILEIEGDYPFETPPGSTLIEEVGKIDASTKGDNTKVAKINVKINKDTIAGSYNLALLVYEEGQTIVKEKRLFSIDIENRESAEVIYIDKVELIPGQITPMKFTINNVGSTPLRELTFRWENEEDIILPVGSDNTKYIKYIDVGESAELDYNVIASATADPDLYKLDLTLTYDDPLTGNEKEITTKAGVYVGGATDFDVAFSGSTNGEYTFSVSNIGSVSASSVTIKIPDQQGWKVTGINSVIIGNLNKGDYTIASFVIRQTSTSLPTTTKDGARTPMEDVIIKLEIDYTDSRGNRNTITKEVPIDPSALQTIDGTTFVPGSKRGMMVAEESFLEKYGVWIIGSIILVFILVIRNKHKKGKLKNPKYTYKKAFRDLFKPKKK